ncbi:MAG: hypothetical protein ACSHWQ_06355 [Spongiibacteraceae bacterium]
MAEEGHVIPEISRKPELFYPFEWNAFHELNTERRFHMGGAGPIPISAIRDYFNMDWIEEDDDYQRFKQLIRTLDSVQMKHIADSQEKGK